MYPPVNPILLQIGSFALHWYGITMTLAIFLGTLVASRYVTRKGANGGAVWDMLLWILIPAIIGARLYYVFIQSPRDSSTTGFNYYMANPSEIFQIWHGGIHIYGALIFGAIALILYLRLNKLPYLLYLDGIALGLALGQAIGRIGNFINQELYGPPTTLPWGLRIDDAHRIPPYDNLAQYPENVRFQPLFLYELLWDGIGFALLLWISRRFANRLRTGDILLLYLIWVPFGRFLLEFMRTDSWFFPGTPFNTAHILTGGAVIGASIALFLRHRNRPVEQVAVENGAIEKGTAEPEDTVINTPETSQTEPEQITVDNKQTLVEEPEDAVISTTEASQAEPDQITVDNRQTNSSGIEKL